VASPHRPREARRGDPDADIGEFLRAEGFDTPESLRQARAVLERNGLTRPGKQRISRAKLPAARGLLDSALLRVCANAECARMGRRPAGSARETAVVSPASCEVCGGSNNRRALAALAACLRANGVERLLVLGGTQAQHAEIQRALAGGGLHVRCVDGATGSHSKRDAAPDREWAQLLVVWGATPLPHKVSKLYTEDPPRHLRVVPLAKRGVEALCKAVIKSFD
jgi:hypothetical protein